MSALDKCWTSHRSTSGLHHASRHENFVLHCDKFCNNDSTFQQMLGACGTSLVSPGWLVLLCCSTTSSKGMSADMERYLNQRKEAVCWWWGTGACRWRAHRTASASPKLCQPQTHWAPRQPLHSWNCYLQQCKHQYTEAQEMPETDHINGANVAALRASKSCSLAEDCCLCHGKS